MSARKVKETCAASVIYAVSLNSSGGSARSSCWTARRRTHITTQALGSRRFLVSFAGSGGHSWSDFGIGNPVHALSRAISLFVDQKPLDPRASPKVSVNVGLIEGGASINAIPASARAKVDIRSESNEKIASSSRAASAVARAEDIENSRALGQKVTATVREIGNRPAAKLPDDAPIIAKIRAVDAHLASVPGSIALRPTPTFLSLSVFPPSRSAPAARAAARTRCRSGIARRAATSA